VTDTQHTTEGTIHFAYELTPASAAALDPAEFAELAAWRGILHTLGLIGQDPDRYDGFAYGNLSLQPGSIAAPGAFVITASQTSGAAELLEEHLVLVRHCNISRFWIEAEGSEPPSSESITHGMIYAVDKRVRCVLHIHNSQIWQAREALKIPQTPADAGYGTPAMAGAVNELMQTYQSRPLVFATAGHEDGVFVCGHSVRDCALLLISNLARARQIPPADE
jgi:hypothetical protein